MDAKSRKGGLVAGESFVQVGVGAVELAAAAWDTPRPRVNVETVIAAVKKRTPSCVALELNQLRQVDFG
jgi:hypothetical protein